MRTILIAASALSLAAAAPAFAQLGGLAGSVGGAVGGTAGAAAGGLTSGASAMGGADIGGAAAEPCIQLPRNHPHYVLG